MEIKSGSKSSGMREMALVFLPAAMLVGLAGCNGNPPTHEQVQQQAAQTTVAVKQGAQQAVDATRKAAAVAESDVNDVATGVKQGLHEGTAKPGDKVNLNSATQVRLAMLPGISLSVAGDIVKQRPYARRHDLVRKGVLTEAQYAQVESQITVD
jgi:DNA uptake protein ComE-like DNA-binding protein